MLLKGPRLIIPGELQEEYLSAYTKAISQQTRYRRMQNNICTGLESMQTLKITPSDARNVSKGLK